MKAMRGSRDIAVLLVEDGVGGQCHPLATLHPIPIV